MRISQTLFCATLAGAALHSIAAQAAKPHVHIVATGGTIASTNYYSGTPGKVGIEQILHAVPAVDSIAAVTGQQFANVASGSITPAMWLSLSRSISDTLHARPDLAGIVVTHGTDTMEETAYFLDLTISDPRPVVVTGAMRPADGIGIDGPANLYNSVRLAASPAARGRGTMIVMNDEIFAARDATKSNAVRPNAFSAPYRGDLGIADPEAIVFHRAAERPAVFDISAIHELPRVDIVYSYAGAGRGAVPPLQSRALQRAMAKGVVVVVGTRTGSGSVPVGDGTNSRTGQIATIGTGDLNVQKARVLLMLALTKSSDSREVAKIFRAQ